MTVTKTWMIERLDCAVEFEGEQNVVRVAYWRCNASDGEGHDATVFGVVSIPFVAEAFTPYEELTEAEVVSWVKSVIGVEQVDAFEAGLDADIAKQIDPPIVAPPLPWAE